MKIRVKKIVAFGPVLDIYEKIKKVFRLRDISLLRSCSIILIKFLFFSFIIAITLFNTI